MKKHFVVRKKRPMKIEKEQNKKPKKIWKLYKTLNTENQLK